jgi:hypothetical protein
MYLSPELQTHRRGRFLASLLEIGSRSDAALPKTGLVLMTGEQFQVSPELQTECLSWARQPGCTLLLLPPYKEDVILPSLDWAIQLQSSSVANHHPESLEGILVDELSYSLQGMDGTGIAGSVSDDANCHTRYWKAHSNSGLIAATTLPLWSISLLDHADRVRAFLAKVEKQTGKPAVKSPEDKAQVDALQPQDVTVLVCCYGFAVVTAESLMARLKEYAVPLLNLASFDLPESIHRLRRLRMIDDREITEGGLSFLQTSNYWSFAENLKGEA